MIKITYNHQNPFAHRFISHIDQQEASQIINKFNSKKDSAAKEHQRQYKRKSDYIEVPMTPQETKILTEFNYNRESLNRNEGQIETRFADIEVGKKKVKQSEGQTIERRQGKDISDSLLSEFQAEQNSNTVSLKQAYLRLWYEKMALENNFTNLQADSNKKDDMINQLRQELGHKNGQQAPMFFNPHTPMHSVSQNKTNIMQHQNQSTSLQSHTIGQPPSSTGLGHWNSMHPNKNFNVVTTRSNF